MSASTDMHGAHGRALKRQSAPFASGRASNRRRVDAPPPTGTVLAPGLVLKPGSDVARLKALWDDAPGDSAVLAPQSAGSRALMDRMEYGAWAAASTCSSRQNGLALTCQPPTGGRSQSQQLAASILSHAGVRTAADGGTVPAVLDPEISRQLAGSGGHSLLASALAHVSLEHGTRVTHDVAGAGLPPCCEHGVRAFVAQQARGGAVEITPAERQLLGLPAAGSFGIRPLWAQRLATTEAVVPHGAALAAEGGAGSTSRPCVGVGAGAGGGAGGGAGAGAGAGAGESVGTRAEVASAGDGVSNASVSNAAAGAFTDRVVDATPTPTGGGSGDDGDPTGAGPSDVPASVQGPSDGDAGGSGDDQVGQGLSAAAAGVADADGDVAMRATPRHARPKPLDDEVLALRQPLHGDAPLPQASVALVISTLTQGDQCEDAARQLDLASCPAQTLLQLCRCVRCVVACA